ncbi:MAG: thioredoxin peroxidase [Candidatus Melainabacteria bacterium RIFCSPLOWO2_02_FULL_35_15]|nr:MAG: thioredoxin peroxidase [Candidatus Melainabacteria bacterium RIFCSPLOWO2_12_FULL_35_11]OGI14080.1 MAG: thioredoxin peroxidase [Candidatus Melainabacteria bacterium RIFCSPLOWO2_02_FULL_35_15]
MNGSSLAECCGPLVSRMAPQFKAQAYADGQIQEISLSDYKGKWVVLFFYPLDFTFVCPTEILEFNKKADEFKKKNAQLIGGSIDSVYSHKSWCEQGGLGKLNFPLISDITKKISQDYGILLDDKGISLRGTFIIDPEGKVRATTIHDLQVGRSVDETLRVLNAFQTGELCPVSWTPGQKTLGK